MDEKELQELRALVKQNIALTEELHREVRKIRRAAAWNRFFQLLWWGLIVGSSWFAYYYYFQPYVTQLLQMYQQVSGSATQVPNLSGELQQLLQRLGPPH